ncbi:Lactate utilization protein B [Streptomyces tendae]
MVAETGTLVVVESEGNGRMCLTLPETLISVVGIEKVVPRWQDLEVFLQTLPRSSTAERMNPYTSMWTGTTDEDGPSTFHLVLLDNGRTDTLADEVGRQALRCIRCSACLNVCPVYERAGGHAYGSVYPGPIGAILSPQLRGTGSEIDASLPYASSLCGACYEVCPVAIDIPEVLVHLRERVVQGGPAVRGGNRVVLKPAKGHAAERAAMRAAQWTFTHPWRAADRAAAGLAHPPACIRARCPVPAGRGEAAGTCWRCPRSRSGTGGSARTAGRAERSEQQGTRTGPGTAGAGGRAGRREALRGGRRQELSARARAAVRRADCGPARREPGGLPGGRAPR